MPPSRHLSLGLAAALATVVLWSGFILLSRFGVSHDLAPIDLAALRFAVSGLVMAPVLAHVGLGGLGLARALFLAATGGLGFALFAYHGFLFAPAAHGGILMPGSLPLFTALLAVLVLGERLARAKTVALVLILAGIAGLGGGALLDGGDGTWRGHALFLTAAVSWACFTIALRRWQVAPLRAVALVAVLAAALYLPVYAVLLDGRLGEVAPLTAVYQGFYQGICAVVLSLFTFTTAVRHLGPTTTTMITASVPAVVTIAAAALLDEALTVPVALGVAAVIAGGVLSAAADRRHARVGTPHPGGPTGREARSEPP